MSSDLEYVVALLDPTALTDECEKMYGRNSDPPYHPSTEEPKREESDRKHRSKTLTTNGSERSILRRRRRFV